ncbi:hypothetical protein PAXINDRAFT_100621 [Paxillus involutus ATCC 200175]|uniref:Steroid 5-alpha reductase C-terminal domain-containing protein n=1 Tax=Paxillus involutus ATCC 200175 TaxID=664439 RepID=A0A0C9U1D8_PAXIN|nr:hypothetical protein PAXINDRAFT_100621 [Paxillus involutus ATCC 200175]
MAPAQVLDRYYLAITLLVTVAYQLLGFAIAWTLQFDKITDFTGGSNFFILALMTFLLGQTFCARNILASTFVMVWAIRLAGFLLFRVLKRGNDTRFDDIRHHFWKFFGFWIGQILWVWVVSLPLTILNSPAVSGANGGVCDRPAFGGRDVSGVVIFCLGWSLEFLADLQKYLWKASKPPRDAIMNTGLWKWSRHPPYFAEILCWWGIWVLCLSPATSPDSGLTPSARAAQYASIVSPLFTMLILLFASGIPPAERSQARKFHVLNSTESGTAPTPSIVRNATGSHQTAWERYKYYLSSTSVLFPIPPMLYRPLPQLVKSTVLLDFPMYRRFETEDGEQEVILV